ncbi:MAG: sensor histidine kinase [Chitinophagaceae bacterium]
MRKIPAHRISLLICFFLLPVLVPAQPSPVSSCIEVNRIGLSRDITSAISMAYLNKEAGLSPDLSAVPFTPGLIHTQAIPDKYVVKKVLLRFTVCNPADTASGIYFFPGLYFREIRLLRAGASSLTPLPDSMPPVAEKWGYRYLSVAPHDTLTVVAELHFLKTYINRIRPTLIRPAYLESFITNIHASESEADLVTYVFSGLLLMMVFYSLSLFLQGANREFLSYSGYAFFTGFMLFTKALYSYHADPVHYFIEEYLDFMLQCLGLIFYMIFMQRFLNTKSQYTFLHKLYNAGIILLSAAIISYTFLHYATDNYPLENKVEAVTKLLLLVMILVFLVYSLQHWKNILLRYLFYGNLFYLLFALVSIGMIVLPGQFQLHGVWGNSLVHYEAGLFFELVFFLAGLNYKNRRRIIDETKEKEKLKAQNMLQEYEKEIAVYKAQQEERQRISADMHDELGSSITAIRLMNEIARKKMKEDAPQEMEKISQSADDVLNKMNAIIWSMNSSNDTMDNLVSYIRAWSLEYLENTPVVCRVHTPEHIPEKELSGDKRRNLFLCVKETLNNMLKHAGATAVDITITIGAELVIRISDNGKGIELDKLRRFGNGLRNIRRRMESIGGSFTIGNDQGTVTTLVLPL